MAKLTIKYKNINDLAPYINNARTHSEEQVTQVAQSITEFGFTNPVLLDGDNGIIAGHGRVMAARQLGMDSVPTIELAGLTEDQKKAYILADNKLAMNAGWDSAMLGTELKTLEDSGFDLSMIGFTDAELKALLNPEVVVDGKTDDDAVPDPKKESTSRLGDVWILGRHRVMCGSSTDEADVARLMGEAQADLVWTDPPYNVDYHGSDGQSIQNDNMNDEQFKQFLLDAFITAYSHTKEGGCVYIAHADTYGHTFRAAMLEAGFLLKQCLIWVKNAPVLGRQDYNWKHEPILYGWKPGAGHYFCGDFSQNTVIDDDEDLGKMDKKQLKDLVNELRQAIPSTVIRQDKPYRNDMHPTMKPVALVERMILNSSTPGQVVLDLFGGSGSTLIASEKTARAARLMELDPKYADVIIRRWQDFTGSQALLEGTMEPFNDIQTEAVVE